MKYQSKRVFSLLMTLAMLVSLFSAVWTPAQAATVDYVTSGNYVYNWGQRDELATFLSPMAEDFYDENGVTYTQLASYSGSSTVSSVPDSALFSQLHELMYSNLDNPTSYDATRDQFKYTDCENSGGSISSFYSGKAIGPDWDSGKTWNREHTWPNSKSNGKSDTNTQRETDIMMLRPASVSENSGRSNTAYGESSNFYDPNELGQNVRGDAARIMLYVYVCWGGSDKHDGALDYMWGSSGVMESKDILLKWIEEDPVDTWELGRNDSVEAITGTRNVFVDYPELAFLLFGEDVPADYDSPSGENAPAVVHDYKETVTVAPTCDKAGERTYTCTECGDSYTEAIPATGHKMANGVCSVCGIQKQSVSFTLGLNGTASHQDGTSNASYSETVDGYTLNIVSGVKMYTTAIDAMGNSCIKLGTGSAVGSFSFTVPNEVSTVVIHIAKYKANATTINVNDVEHTINGSSNDGQYDAIEVDTSVNKTVSLTTVSGGVRAMVNTIDYVMAAICDHAYTSHVTTAATCGKDGVCTYTCSVCGNSYTEAIPATGEHTYDNACDADCNACGITRTPAKHAYTADCDTTCDVCGYERSASAGGETTVTFDADKTQRMEFSTTIQVWQNDALIITNNKASATSNVADYSDPVRFYKGSQIIIAYPGMTSLVIDAPTGTYGTPWAATLDAAGLTYEVDGGVYTVTFADATDSITLTASAQIRANSITAFGAGAEHSYSYDCDADCDACGAVREAAEHTYDDDYDADCNVCGAIREVNYNLFTFGGFSASEDVRGVAFEYTVAAQGITLQNYKGDYTNATITPNDRQQSAKLVAMGAVVSNKADMALTLDNLQENGTVIDIPAVYFFGVEDDTATYAVRVIEIPEGQENTLIYARPYYVYEDADGNSIVCYGSVASSCYAKLIG